MSAAELLVVDDEAAVRELLATTFEQAGFHPRCAEDAERAQVLLSAMAPDLIVLDWMLPGLSGVDWTRRLRQDERYREIPIILLTARSKYDDKVGGLEAGADDYITKPFSPRELVARVKTILRRTGRNQHDARISVDGIVLDTEQHHVSIDGQTLALSPTEYRLLVFFMTHPNKVFNRSQLLNHVWGRQTGTDDRTVDVHILRLRKELAQYRREDLVQTVRGFGYRFSERR